MKKIILASAIVAIGAASAFAQGTVKFYNISSLYLVSTNGATTGAVATSSTAPNGYYYTLFWDASAPTSSNPLTGGWTQATTDGTTPITSVNYAIAGGINGTGGTGGTPVSGIALGGAAYFEIAGWSASLGTTWSAVSSQYSSQTWLANGYFGISSESGLLTTGGAGTPAAGATPLFAATSPGITSGWLLNAVSATPTPEPSTMALAAIGGASLLLFRRRK